MNKSRSASVVRNSASFVYSKFNSVSANNTLGSDLDSESQCALMFTTTIGERERNMVVTTAASIPSVCVACVRACVACINECVCMCTLCIRPDT